MSRRSSLEHKTEAGSSDDYEDRPRSKSRVRYRRYSLELKTDPGSLDDHKDFSAPSPENQPGEGEKSECADNLSPGAPSKRTPTTSRRLQRTSSREPVEPDSSCPRSLDGNDRKDSKSPTAKTAYTPAIEKALNLGIISKSQLKELKAAGLTIAEDEK